MLTQQRHLLDREENTHTYYSEDRERAWRLDPQAFSDMGSPDSVTLTVRPGDQMNQEVTLTSTTAFDRAAECIREGESLVVRVERRGWLEAADAWTRLGGALADAENRRAFAPA